MRPPDDIAAVRRELLDRVWFGRHLVLAEQVEAGEAPNDDVWQGALAYAERMRKQYPDLDEPLSEFEWGMLNGKLSALRWAGGEPWEVTLDT